MELLFKIQQCLVKKFECDLCDAGYAGFMTPHSHQHLYEHKISLTSR